MTALRVIFLGNDPWSVPTLEALADAEDICVVLVITNPPRAAGRGSRLTPTSVADAARGLDLELLETDGVRSAGGDAIGEMAPDALVVVAYGVMLPAEVLRMPRLGAVNLHLSLLPRWRGAAPVQRAILEGDDRTGVSVMMIDEGLDTGPVIATLEEPIRVEDDAGSLGRRLSELGAPLVIDSLRALGAGTAAPVRQRDAGATYAAKLAPDERTIDWRDPADAIERRVRAFAPTPGATTTFRGAALKVLRAEASERDDVLTSAAATGEVRIGFGGAPAVAAGDGWVTLLEVAPSGRARMSGADWARGARLEREERCA